VRLGLRAISAKGNSSHFSARNPRLRSTTLKWLKAKQRDYRVEERLRLRSNGRDRVEGETLVGVKNLAAVLSRHPPSRLHGALSVSGARVEEA